MSRNRAPGLELLSPASVATITAPEPREQPPARTQKSLIKTNGSGHRLPRGRTGLSRGAPACKGLITGVWRAFPGAEPPHPLGKQGRDETSSTTWGCGGGEGAGRGLPPGQGREHSN